MNRGARSTWRWGRGFRRKGLPFRVRSFSLAHSAHAEHMEGLLAVQAGDGIALNSSAHPTHDWVGPQQYETAFLRAWLKRVPLIPAVP